MARTKSKTTKEQLDIALQKKEQLINELAAVKKDIAYLEAEVKKEQITELVKVIDEKGISIDDVMDLVKNHNEN